MHGEQDTWVHPAQSMELYRALEILNKTPVRLVTDPDEGHGLRRAAARLDFSMRLMRWMDHFLLQDNKQAPPFALDHGLFIQQKEPN